MMSGNSMAAPHMTGIAALIRQYIVNSRDVFKVSSSGMSDLISQLLVSTAVPQKDGNAYYSPRQQGAGLVNAAAAISTPAYITVEGKHVGKLELLDDLNKTGKYDFSFQVNNISDKELKYQAKVVLMRPDTQTAETTWGNKTVWSSHDVVISETELGEITVPAKGKQTVQKSVSLTESQKSQLNNMFTNGVYVEGFVILTDEAGENPQIGLPLLAFYGDWTAAPIFDRSNWFDEAADGESVYNNESAWGTNLLGVTVDSVSYFDLGQNLFRSEEGDQTTYHKENITISPNGDIFFEYINDIILYQLRNARVVVVDVKDQDTGEVYFKDWASYSFKTMYQASYGFALPFSLYGTYPVWDGTDLDGNVLPSGTKCTYTITAYGEGDYGEEIFVDSEGRNVTNFDAVMNGEIVPTFNNHPMDMTGDVISFPIVVDTVAPKLENNAVTFFEKYGRTYMVGKVYDEDGSLASIEVAPYVTRTYKEGYGDPDYIESSVDRVNPFYLEDIYDAAAKERTFIADVTEYVRKPSYDDAYYDYKWNGSIVLSCGDYGANDRSYAIHVDTSEGIVLSQTSARLHPGSEFELSVNDNSFGVSEVTRVSSNPEVATVDEYGVVKGVAPGQAIITVSNGTSSGICVVVVEDYNTEVIDFKLSMDKFTGLKPDGECVVKITDLEPADVVIEENRWVVEEDDDYAQDYVEGLIRVDKETGDARSGSLYLYVRQSDTPIPAGEGTLTVTLNGVSRSMRIGWQDIYTDYYQDDLVSASNYSSQSVYISQGQTATLDAKYRQANQHSTCDVITELTGLKLDGPDFYKDGASTYSARLVNEEGYALPEDIKMYTVYPDHEVEIPKDGYGARYSYDPATGVIDVPYTPYGSANKMKIVAEGIVSEGNPAGQMSGETYTKPDSLYGPFDWAVTEGNGNLELVDQTDNYGDTHQVAKYTPSEPGVSYITATSKDKQYSINYVVVSEVIKAEKIELDQTRVKMTEGEKITVTPTLSPEPTLAEDKEVVWTSFNESVATVENGEITAVSEGYAYIKAHTTADNRVMACVLVQVTGEEKPPVTDRTTIQLSDEEITLDVNESKTITATVTSTNEENKTVTWSSNNRNVATVTANGKVTAIAKGVATIKAETPDGVTATCKVTVNKPADPDVPVKNEPTSITLDNETLELKVNETKAITATVAPATAENRAVTWSSNNTDVATVTGGRVTAISKGVATITAKTVNGLTATCRVTVSEAGSVVDPSKNEPTGISLNKDTLTLEVNGTDTLAATVVPETAENRSVAWSTNNPDVAVVNASGKVTAIGAGQATITARTVNGLTETCKVTVLKGERQEQQELSISGISSLTYSKSSTLRVTGGSGTGDITWSIESGKNYATINARTGKVLATGIGTVKVKAVKAGDGRYKDASATFQFKTVLPKIKQTFAANGVKYRLTSVSKGNETAAYAGTVDKNVTRVVIPSSVKIGNRTFKVTIIGKNALKGYQKLESVSIHKNITRINASAFQDCKALTKVTLPANVKIINRDAFNGDKNLKSIVVKSTKVTKVLANAFKGIHKHAKIKVPASKLKQYQKIFSSKGQPKTVKITK